MRVRSAIAAAAALLGACGGAAQSPPATGDVAPVDYAKPASWICRPGVDDGTCSTNLDAVAIDVSGKRTPAPYVAAKDPKVDCFYVYPTSSRDPTMFSDLTPGRDEEERAVHAQAARLGAVCRLFVPTYHQLTDAGLAWSMRQDGKGGGGEGKAINAKDGPLPLDVPYRDVLAAWRAYLAHDNRGRGVILVGHSQGAFLLRRLIAAEIDGRPVQKRLVAAYLAGNDRLTGTSFRTIRPCAAVAETGCLVAWSSYAEDDAGPRIFGGGAGALCIDPARPGGGRAPLRSYLPNPLHGSDPAAPPYVETIGQLSGECVADKDGAVLRIRVEAGPHAELLRRMMLRFPKGWGLHAYDIGLVQGDMIEMMRAQVAAWR